MEVLDGPQPDVEYGVGVPLGGQLVERGPHPRATPSTAGGGAERGGLG